MPKIRQEGPFSFFFYSLERGEPPHVHISRDRSTAKVWLDPIALARSKRFGAPELAAIMKIVRERWTEFLDAWHGYFGTGSS